MKREKFEFLGAVMTLIGTIIGAGVLAVPYAISKAGFITGLINLVILATAVIMLNLYIGEIALRTKGKYQLTGYANKYIGSSGRKLMAFSMMFVVYGALVAYMVGIGKSFSSILGVQNASIGFFGLSVGFDVLFGILFFILGSAIINFGLKGVEKSEIIMGGSLILLLIIISVVSLTGFNAKNVMNFDVHKIFLPYGVILFALAGAIAVPEMCEEMKDKKKLKKAIMLGTIIPAVLYFLFSLSTIGLCGAKTSEIAVVCLSDRFGEIMLLVGNIFAILAMATSFLSLGLGLKEMYNYDYKMSKKKSWVLACFIPLILFIALSFFLKQERFFRIIDITGGIAMTLQGILIILILQKAKKFGDRKPEYNTKSGKLISVSIIIVFLLGMLYVLWDFFKEAIFSALRV